MFYDTLRPACGAECKPGCNCGKYVEVWNDVFMQYERRIKNKELGIRDSSEGVEYEFVPLKQKNVDTGMGLERTLAVLNGKTSAFETELFVPITEAIVRIMGATGTTREEFVHSNERALRIMTDHLRAATFILGDEHGVVPSNVEHGYILRRFIRRSIRYGRMIGITKPFTAEVADVVINAFAAAYPELTTNRARVLSELTKEEERFAATLQQGLKELERFLQKSEDVSGEDAFILFSTYGFPFEMTEEIVHERQRQVDRAGFEQAFAHHQELSRVGAEKKFAGGLADHSVETTRLHTANHLILQAMKNILGPSVSQRGSNITKERLRFDFSWDAKLTAEQIVSIEQTVNARVAEDLSVHYEIMDLEKARTIGATGVFDERYGEKVKVYFIGRPGSYFSKEICGGPHVRHTSQVGTMKIIKEEAVAQGIRRIKAIVSGGTELKEGEVAEGLTSV
jgi:alanyl-tRNA synthetase